MSDLFNNVKVGDTVHYLTPQGQRGKGKVVIKHESGSHVVINRGKGQPQVVNDRNYVKHERGGKVIGALLSRLKEDVRSPTDAEYAVAKKFMNSKKNAADLTLSGLGVHKKTGNIHVHIDTKDGRGEGSHHVISPEGKELKEATWQGAGDPYNWDPVARAQVFAAAKKKVKRLPGAPQPNKLETGRAYKPTYNPPPRRGTANEEIVQEGNIPKVHGFSNFKDMANSWHDHNERFGRKEPEFETKEVGVGDHKWHQTTHIGYDRHDRGWIVGVFNHTKGKGSEEGHGTHHHWSQGLDEDAKEAEGLAARAAKTKRSKTKKKRLHELNNPTLVSYVSKAIANRKKNQVRSRNAWLVHDPDNLGGADGERAKYEHDKAQSKVDRRSKGIKNAVRKIAGKLPATKANEARENEWSANQQLAATAKKPAKGHYLMRDGRKLSGPHSPEDAVKQYKNMSDSKGVKIVHVKEAAEKTRKAAEKAIRLAKKKAKVDTKPALNLPDKGTAAPMEGTHADKGADDAKI